MGVKNKRPYYKKSNANIFIWYDANEEIWALTDRSALNEQDPELYGYIDSMAWDVSSISKTKNWQIADSNGDWDEKKNMRIEKQESRGFLGSLLTDEVPETRLAAQAAMEQSVSQMSCFWGDFKKVKGRVKANTQCIKELKTTQQTVQEKQRDIIGRLEKLENDSNKDSYANLVKKIELVEGQVKILNKSKVYKRTNNRKRQRDRIPKTSIEDLIHDNNLEKATVADMRGFLKKKKRQRLLIDDKPIIIKGNKSALLARIKKLLANPEKKAPRPDIKEAGRSAIQKRKEVDEAREKRLITRQRKKEQMRQDRVQRVS